MHLLLGEPPQGTLVSLTQPTVEKTTVRNTVEKEILDDCVALLTKLKLDRRLWSGEVGLSPARREDITDLLRRHQALTIAAMPRQPKGDRS